MSEYRKRKIHIVPLRHTPSAKVPATTRTYGSLCGITITREKRIAIARRIREARYNTVLTKQEREARTTDHKPILTTKELGDRCRKIAGIVRSDVGYGVCLISHWESGRRLPNMHQLITLAKATATEPWELLGIDPDARIFKAKRK